MAYASSFRLNFTSGGVKRANYGHLLVSYSFSYTIYNLRRSVEDPRSEEFFMGVASDIEMGKDIHPLANLPPYCFCVSEYGYLRWQARSATCWAATRWRRRVRRTWISLTATTREWMGELRRFQIIKENISFSGLMDHENVQRWRRYCHLSVCHMCLLSFVFRARHSTFARPATPKLNPAERGSSTDRRRL